MRERDWLAARARAMPDAPAVIDAGVAAAVSRDGGRATPAVATTTWSFADLDARVDRLAGRLAAAGIGPGDRVGLRSPPRPAAVAVTHAAIRVGATLVGLSPGAPAAELRPRIDRADLDLLVGPPVAVDTDATGDTDATDATGDAIAALSDVVPVARVGDGRGRPTRDRLPAPAAVDAVDWTPTDTVVALFTSGTTGRPKLVPLTVRNLYASAVAAALRLDVRPADRWASPLPPSSMGGLAPFYRGVLHGSAVVLAPTDAAGLRAALRRTDATGLSIVPTLLRRLLDDALADVSAARPGERDEDRDDDSPSSESLPAVVPDTLRTVLVGGAPAPPPLVERCLAAAVPVYPTYGMTEAASQVATARPAEVAADPATVGRPLLFTRVTIVDPDTGEPQPPGTAGEIVVDGPTVTPGYLDDATPRDEHGLHTGDRGRLTDGRLTVLGRLDETIITGGHNVDPAEVAAVIRAHPAVAEVAVVGLDDPEYGQRVAALVTLADQPPTAPPLAGSPDGAGHDGDRPDADAGAADHAADRAAVASGVTDRIMAHCRERLASHKLPRPLVVGPIPRTASGTVDREAVRGRLRAAARRD